MTIAHNSGVKYRPEIDGLRAIAVVAVLFYHFQFLILNRQIFSGGFLGVDVFFVISGYLISSILLREIRSRKFSFFTFWERRARRILPALYMMLAATIPLAWWILLPKGFIEYAKSLIATVLFGANFFFWRQDSYLAEASAFKPLLHTWSLSLEEQYYFLFPILLLLVMRKLGARVLFSMAVISIGSLLWAQWSSVFHPEAGFYLLPARAWELACGCMLAEMEARHGRKARKHDGWFAFLGFSLVGISILVFKDSFPHPSFLTTLPVLGTMLLIRYSGGQDWTSRLLKSRAFTQIGLISYSLYLWHLPTLVFFRLQTNEVSLPTKFILVATSMLLGWWSWHFVERPFRINGKIPSHRFWLTLAIASLALIALGASIVFKDGVPGRFNPMVLSAAIAETPSEILKQEGRICFGRSPKGACEFGVSNGHPRLVVLGDSHLASLTSIFWSELEAQGGSLLDLTYAGCFYLPGLEAKQNGHTARCTKSINDLRRQKLLSLPPAIVVMGGRMPLYLSGDGFDNGEGGVEQSPRFVFDKPDGSASEADRLEAIRLSLSSGVQGLLAHGHKVVLLYPIPEVGWSVPDSVRRFFNEHGPDTTLPLEAISTSYEVYRRRSAATFKLYDSLADHPNLLRLKPHELFCGDPLPARCTTHSNQEVYYFDHNHLSLAGARRLVDNILRTIRTRWAP